MSRPRTRLGTGDLALIATFAALVAALSLVSVYPFGPSVPVTGQTLGVMLAGSVLGAWRAFLALLTYLGVGALGLPVFAGGTAGLAVLAQPTAGFLLGFPLGALVIGLLVDRRLPGYSLFLGLLANIVGGIVVVYLLGVPVLALATGTGLFAALTVMAPFLVGDLTKAVAATLVAKGVHRAYPQPPLRVAAR